MPKADHPMFLERTPEAAAIQTATVLAWLAECELATLEDLQGRSRPPKRELARHQEIVDRVVEQCLDLRIRPAGLRGTTCQRLAEAMRQQLQTKHYLWMEHCLTPFMVTVCPDRLVGGSAKILIIAHGDKGYGYRQAWQDAGVPFAHGMALLMLCFVAYRDELPRADTWVIEQYPAYRERLLAIEDEVLNG